MSDEATFQPTRDTENLLQEESFNGKEWLHKATSILSSRTVIMKDQTNVLRNLEELQLTRTDLINMGLNEIPTRFLDSAPMDCLLEKQPDLINMATSLINEYTN